MHAQPTPGKGQRRARSTAHISRVGNDTESAAQSQALDAQSTPPVANDVAPTPVVLAETHSRWLAWLPLRHSFSWWPASWRPRVTWFWIGLGAIAVFALALRVYGLNWDANNHLHPDEREIVFVAMCLSFPGQIALRAGNCAPAASGPGWFFSPNSPLNPHFFAYGSLPLYLLALVCHGLAWLTHLTGGRFVPSDGGTWDDFNHFTLVGRVLSALFDTGSVAVIGLLGRRLAGWRVGLLAAALVAVIPFEVQVSHFYAVDTVLTFFILLTLWACLRLAQGPRDQALTTEGNVPVPASTTKEADTWQLARPAWEAWRSGLLVGVCFGLALASKVSALPLLLPIGLALLLRVRRRGLDDGLLALLGTGAATILAFAITSPYVLIDWPTFLTQVHEQTALSQGQLDYPYVRQFANTTPYLYELQQLLRFDMGPLLGVLGLAGAAWAGWRVWRHWDDDWLVIAGWIVIYFAIIGSAYTKFTRYMLPLFPLFALCGAALLGTLAVAGTRTLARWQTHPPHLGRRLSLLLTRPLAAARWLTALYGVRWWRTLVTALGITVLLASTFLALALDNIYSTPNTRVQASEWIYDHVPAGATITSEVWDDSLPILVPPAHPGPGFGLTPAGHVIEPGEYNNVALDLYAEDTPAKADQLAQQLTSANVIVISSQRLVGSIPKLPDRYPMTTRYYQLLFAGQLGFHLAAQFQSAPHLFGLTLSDSGADESFSVYDHPPVWIFVRDGAAKDGAAKTADQMHALLTAGIALPADSQRSGAQKSLLLSPADIAANNQMPALGIQFPLDSFSNHFPLLVWLVIVELLGLLSFPLAYFAFPGLRDRGWGLSKLLGLLVLAYLIWLPASLRLLPFTTGTTVAAFVLLAVVSAALVWWHRDELWSFLRARWRLLAICEGSFLAAFAFFTWIRALDPDLWHIWRGGEKPMELAFLNGILHSQFFPPADPWFSGGAINYYYYGQYLVAILIRLTGVAPTTAFNLAIPLLFALTFTAAFSVAAGMTRRWWAGLVAGFALVVAGNLDGLWQAIGQWRAVLAHNAPPPFDYWASSRVIPYTINEFPYWSFLYADLHPHLIDLAVVVLIIASCGSLLIATRAPLRVIVPALVALTLALGAAGVINTWDFPTMAVLVVATLILRELRIAGGGNWRAVGARLRWPVLRRLAAQIILVVGGAYAIYLPFYAHYQNFVSGIGHVTTPTDPNQFFTLFGIWLFLLASFFIVELRDRIEARLTRATSDAAQAASVRLWIAVLASLLVLTLAYLAGVKYLLAVLLVAGFILALNPRHPPLKLLTYALLLLGLAVALGVEFIYVRDFLDGGAYERMNTVFKFYYQVWVCFALGGALAFVQLAPRVIGAARHVSARITRPRGEEMHADPANANEPAIMTFGQAASLSLRTIWVTAFVALLAGSLVFLVEGTSARLSDPAQWAQVQPPPRGIQPQGLSLDGMAYMRGWYPTEYAAIQWMNSHISGTPTIMVAATGPYAIHISDYTGLPSVLITGHEYEQRYASEVAARQGDVQTFFTTGDPELALNILHQYGVRYLYLGPTERTCPTTDASGNCVPAPPDAVQKYATLTQMGALKPVYQNSDVTIYEVVR